MSSPIGAVTEVISAPMRPATVAHRLFVLSLLTKATLGLTQLVAGAALAVIPADRIEGVVGVLTRAELAEDPSDPLASLLMRALVMPAPEWRFYTVYLLLHGAVNLGVAVALGFGHRAAHAVSIAVLASFVVYQVWKYLHGGGPMLLVLTAIDLAVIALTLLEARRTGYRA